MTTAEQRAYSNGFIVGMASKGVVVNQVEAGRERFRIVPINSKLSLLTLNAKRLPPIRFVPYTPYTVEVSG